VSRRRRGLRGRWPAFVALLAATAAGDPAAQAARLPQDAAGLGVTRSLDAAPPTGVGVTRSLDAAPPPASADGGVTQSLDTALPPELAGVGVTQNLDAALPLELPFVDEDGAVVSFGDLFAGDRPALLVFAYYRCPMLCNVVLEGLVETLRGMDWLPGREFEVVVVSIDPDDRPDQALARKRRVVAALGKPEAAAGWHFLTGGRAAIERLTAAAGFRYAWLPQQGEFAHAAALHVITPDGRISRYLLGVRTEPQTLRLSLVEAAAGRIGSFADQFLLYCYRYDAATGRYTPVAWRIMQVGGLVTLLVLGGTLALLWRREARPSGRTA